MNNIRERNWRQASSRIATSWSRNHRGGTFSLNRETGSTEPGFSQNTTVAYTATPRTPQGMAGARRDRNEEE